MSRSIFLSLIAYSLILVGILRVRGEMITLALPFVVYLLAGFLRTPNEIKLEATRHLSNERVGPNSDVVVRVTVTNSGEAL